MKAKLEYLMSQTGLRSGQIAKMLDVKASVISHLLLGRNQPNYKLTAKIISVFSDYSPLWWLGLTDNPHATVATSETGQASDAGQGNQQFPKSTPRFEEQSLFGSSVANEVTTPETTSSQPSVASSFSSSEVERVIVIYKDKSFESFTPKK